MKLVDSQSIGYVPIEYDSIPYDLVEQLTDGVWELEMAFAERVSLEEPATFSFVVLRQPNSGFHFIWDPIKGGDPEYCDYLFNRDIDQYGRQAQDLTNSGDLKKLAVIREVMRRENIPERLRELASFGRRR